MNRETWIRPELCYRSATCGMTSSPIVLSGSIARAGAYSSEI